MSGLESGLGSGQHFVSYLVVLEGRGHRALFYCKPFESPISLIELGVTPRLPLFLSRKATAKQS
jgi:hypothetical protein